MHFSHFGILATLVSSSFALFIKRDPIVNWTTVADSLTAVDPTNDTFGCASDCEIWGLVKQVASEYPVKSFDFCSRRSGELFETCRECLDGEQDAFLPKNNERLQAIQLFMKTSGQCGIFNSSSLYVSDSDIMNNTSSGVTIPLPFNSSQTSSIWDTTSGTFVTSSTDIVSPSASVTSDDAVTSIEPIVSGNDTPSPSPSVALDDIMASSESPTSFTSTSVTTAYATVVGTAVTTRSARASSFTSTSVTGGGTGPMRLSDAVLLVISVVFGGLCYL